MKIERIDPPMRRPVAITIAKIAVPLFVAIFRKRNE